MHRRTGGGPGKLGTRAAVSALCLVVALAALALAHHYRAYPQLFWDAHVYADAIGRWRAGTDAYQTGPAGIPFVYPPIFLVAASRLEHIVGPSVGWYVYLALTFAATFAVPWLMATLYAKRTWLTFPLACALFFAGPRLAGASTLLSGNINTLCFAVILVAGTAGVRRGKWTLFYFAVGTASLIKISFLGLLLLPLFASADVFAAIAASLGTCVAVIAGYFAEGKMFPAACESFQQNLLHHAIRTHHDGYAVLGVIRHILIGIHAGGGLVLPGVAHFIYCVVAVGALVVARIRMGARVVEGKSTWLSLILITTITINPRMVDYDAAIAAIPAIVILISGVMSPKLRVWCAAASGLVIACLIAAPTGTGSLVLLLCGLGIGFAELAQSAARREEEGETEPQSSGARR